MAMEQTGAASTPGGAGHWAAANVPSAGGDTWQGLDPTCWWGGERQGWERRSICG